MAKLKFADISKPQNWLMLVLVFIIGLVTWSYSWVFDYRYDIDRFNHDFANSQYVWPRGEVELNDSDLYKVVGYKLVLGENPFFINHEVPPFGKSLYGLAIYLTNNPYYISYLFYLISIGLVFYLSELVFKKRLTSWLAACLMAINPLTAFQVAQTMLDLPLTVFLLLHLICLFKVKQSQKPLLWVGLAGFFIGLMTGTKIGYYTPGILLLAAIWLWFIKQRWGVIVLSLTTFIGYVFSWWSYFIYHPNPIPWFRLHDRIIDFYDGSRAAPYYLNQLQTIIFNQYQGWWRSDSIPMVEWSVILPLGLFLIIYYLLKFKAIIKTNQYLAYLIGLTTLLLIMNSLVPFWPRYLMLVVPLFILIIANLFSKKWYTIVIILVISLPYLWSILSIH